MNLPVIETEDRRFARRMARFELAQARRRRADGKPDRAAVALSRARLWRLQSLTHGLETATTTQTKAGAMRPAPHKTQADAMPATGEIQ